MPGWTPIADFDWLPTIPGGAEAHPEF
jgi:hypothetical protein